MKICEELMQNTTLTCLNLSGLKSLKRDLFIYLKIGTKLSILIANRIGYKGAKYICELLKSNTTLTGLNLRREMNQ